MNSELFLVGGLTTPCRRVVAPRRDPWRRSSARGPRLKGQVVRQWRGTPTGALAIAVAAALAIAAMPITPPGDPTASDLLASVTTTHEALGAFETSGVVESEIIDSHGQVGPLLFGRRDFTAFYSAPESFLFSMVHRGSSDYKPWSLVLAVEAASATLASPPALETKTSGVPEALSGASAITSQAAAVLVGLLLPEAESGFRVSDLVEGHVAGAETIRNVACWKLKGKFAARNRAATMWVSKEGSFVLRVVLTYSVDDGSVHRHTIDFTSLHVQQAGAVTMEAVPPGMSDQ